MFMLIDCDNFFVSCERIFQPKLKNRPTVVLSNNDGCVVARSPEAKKIGIPMCSPYFKIEKALKNADGIALSSNYELYADISRRVMTILHDYFTDIEIYSIDEAFAYFSSDATPIKTAKQIREQILQQIGISVSIGIAPTKTLCKLAGSFAKSHKKICFLSQKEQVNTLLTNTDVGDIWGIGRHIAKKLNFMGFFSGLDLKNADPVLIRQAFGINIEKTLRELNGFSCLEISSAEQQKSIISSRSFEFEINSCPKLKQIIAEFVDNACQRLRKQNALASGIMVHICTNRFNPKQPQYQNACNIFLDQPSNNTGLFMKAMSQGLEQIFRKGFWYKKAGVMLFDIQSAKTTQNNLFSTVAPDIRSQKLMNACDKLNAQMGRKTVYFGLQSPGIKHYIRREFKSSAYTTSWQELVRVS